MYCDTGKFSDHSSHGMFRLYCINHAYNVLYLINQEPYSCKRKKIDKIQHIFHFTQID